jgi:hypothetical protein
MEAVQRWPKVAIRWCRKHNTREWEHFNYQEHETDTNANVMFLTDATPHHLPYSTQPSNQSVWLPLWTHSWIHHQVCQEAYQSITGVMVLTIWQIPPFNSATRFLWIVLSCSFTKDHNQLSHMVRSGLLGGQMRGPCCQIHSGNWLFQKAHTSAA